MTAGAAWMVAGLVLAGLEMMLPGVFMLWIGLAALGTGAVTVLGDLGWHAQLGLFVGLNALLIGAAGWQLRRRPARDTVNAPGAGVIGQTCQALSFADGEGRVTLGDGTWAARLAGGATPGPGERLLVVGLDGTTLLVAPRG